MNPFALKRSSELPPPPEIRNKPVLTRVAFSLLSAEVWPRFSTSENDCAEDESGPARSIANIAYSAQPVTICESIESPDRRSQFGVRLIQVQKRGSLRSRGPVAIADFTVRSL